MGWLLTLYSMRKQWQSNKEWKSWFQSYFHSLLGNKFIGAFLDIASTIQDVQLLEGLEPGEFEAYYTHWGLNLNKLAPETLQADGCLQAVCQGPYDDYAMYIRLVKAGSKDIRGDYTSEHCQPAMKRLMSLRSKIEHALDKIQVLKDTMPLGRDSYIWNELVLLPLLWTARFLQARILLAQSYLTYITMREGVSKGLNMMANAMEGESLCRQALSAQDEYIRLRPGFNRCDYPKEIDPETLRNLVAWWRKLRSKPQLCLDLDICAFLDKVETEATK
jgi:hypothetical protein